MNAQHIEVAVAKLFGIREKIIVPNVSWGLPGLGHEADLLVVSEQGYLTEIEIKISRDDIKQDLKKRHQHNSKYVKRLYFAVPEKLKTDENIPQRAGIISVTENPNSAQYYRATIVRPAKINSQSRPLSNEQMMKLMRLGCMRIWTLKEKLSYWILENSRLKKKKVV